ncbi:hypothetical protein F7C95_12810 [Opitutia bacterium ISCC 51]|nr:hypothetical protein F7C95_12810 [Opitutae bacterium ISCC 51]QXD26896.1 hypothetical protein GA003_12735 [Opitutae bacterium ISCC 52]
MEKLTLLYMCQKLAVVSIALLLPIKLFSLEIYLSFGNSQNAYVYKSEDLIAQEVYLNIYERSVATPDSSTFLPSGITIVGNFIYWIDGLERLSAERLEIPSLRAQKSNGS